MKRMLIYTGMKGEEVEYQPYSGESLIGGYTDYLPNLRWLSHSECGEVLLAVI